MHFSRKKLLRVPVPNRKYPLTGGAEAHNGTPDGPAAPSQGNEAERKPEVIEAGRAERLGRTLSLLLSTLFDIDRKLKRYVGGLVQSMDQPTHIGLLALGR